MPARARRLKPGEECLRLARRADNARLCELFRSNTMETDLQLVVERDPDFFALYDIQEVDQRTFVLTDGPGDDAPIEGMASVLCRDGYLRGERIRVGYLGDLRLSPRVRGGRFLGSHFGPQFREACEHLGCEVALTAILDANAAARWALVRRHARYPDQPLYRAIASFRMLNVQFTWRRRRRSSWTVRRAREADLAPIAAMLGEDHRHRPFGYVIDESVLRRRLVRWPDIGVESFYVAEDGRGRLCGVCAAWDAERVKRYRVLAYRGRMRWLRRGFDLQALVTGSPRLPAPGGRLRYFYLTHTSVRDEDPEVMAALLDRIYDDHLGRGYHFMSACVLEGDPLAQAYSRYRTTVVPATLYAVSAPGSVYSALDIGACRPGFEMALV
jgi:hypothetical protein